MADGLSMRNKITAVLRKVHATSRPVYFREVSRTGGNSVLGVGGTVSETDTLVDPQPAVEKLKSFDIAFSGDLYQLGDHKFTFSGDVPEEILRTRLIVYGTEVLRIIRYDSQAFGGITVAWTVIARTVVPGA